MIYAKNLITIVPISTMMTPTGFNLWVLLHKSVEQEHMQAGIPSGGTPLHFPVSKSFWQTDTFLLLSMFARKSPHSRIAKSSPWRKLFRFSKGNISQPVKNTSLIDSDADVWTVNNFLRDIVDTLGAVWATFVALKCRYWNIYLWFYVHTTHIIILKKHTVSKAESK